MKHNAGKCTFGCSSGEYFGKEDDMGRKAKISREMILSAAYSILDEEGISAVGIKPIAEKLGCSTQPISWHFGSMLELRKALLSYAGEQCWGSIGKEMEGKDPLDAFFATGVHYISIACDHPHVFRFMHMDDPRSAVGADALGDSSIFTMQMDHMAAEMLSSAYPKIPKKVIGQAVQDTVIYTHGLATMMIWDNFRMPKKEACKMIFQMGIKILSSIGIDTEGRKMPRL